MKKATKTLLLMLCAVVLVVSSILGTVAYLTSTDTVTNTFTVGNVAITLQERDLNQTTGELNSDALVNTVFNEIKFVPGRAIKKQPVITIGANSEDCYLFVKVENAGTDAQGNIIDILDNGTFNPTTGWSEVAGNEGWYQYDGTDAGKTNVYATKGEVIQVFDNFTCDNLSSEDTAKMAGGSIKVTAYAIQVEGFADQAAAFAEISK